MVFAAMVAVFLICAAAGVPIVFSLGVSAIFGLVIGHYPIDQLASSMVSASQSWVLLAIPTFVFAGNLMERCGMSYALVDLARALVGWLRGGLGMSVMVAEYFFSGISGSTVADVSAIGATLTPPMLKADYKRDQAASLIASASAMGILVPPAIFMIVLGQVTDTSVVALFLAGFLPAALTALCLLALIFVQANRQGWPKDNRPNWGQFLRAFRHSLVPLVVPVLILLGFYFGVFTATEAGAVVALYAVLAALLYYRNVSAREILKLVYESGLLTAVVLFLLAVASIYQFLLGKLGVPAMLGELLRPLQGSPTLFLLAVAILVMLFGMVLEGLPAAVILIPIALPTAKQIGINSVHFDIVLTAAVGLGLFLPPMGIGLLMALRFAGISVGEHIKAYWPYLVTLGFALLLITAFPEVSLVIPRSAGFVR